MIEVWIGQIIYGLILLTLIHMVTKLRGQVEHLQTEVRNLHNEDSLRLQEERRMRADIQGLQRQTLTLDREAKARRPMR